MTSAAPLVVPVGLGDRAYDILIGPSLIDQAGELITRVMPGVRAAIVVDDTVAALHLPRLQAALSSGGIDSVPVEVPAGEPSKSFAVLQDVVDRILAARLERGDVVIAFGGGVIGDLAGFAAGIVRRGMKFVQMPTTLLAMVDSSVGGKTGINARHGKNLIGLFNQPQLVIADTDLLATLSPREFRAGYAEVVKYGLIGDRPFFDWLETHHADLFARGPALTQAIAVSCRAKAKVVEEDEHETGVRALLNLGHTFGHALEKAVGYNTDRLVHGEGVAIGMTLAHQFSVHMNLLSPDDATRMERHLTACGLPTRLDQIPGGVGGVDGLMAAIGQDKKVKRGRLTFILTRGIGEAFIADDVPADVVRDFLAAKLNGH
jgi:3-dehydroquinate synthase